MSPYDRTVKTARQGHPPCNRVCWEPLGDGWLPTVGVNDACVWDAERTVWVRCDERNKP